MNQPLISVIIPVYKVEKYIHRCIKSVLNQTYKNFELILVDDGSPDNSGKICDNYALKDNRIKVIHKQNGGVSSARNAGIDVATGEYINFIDSDDWVPVDSLENLYNAIIENDADLVIGAEENREINIKVVNIESKRVNFIQSNNEDIVYVLSHYLLSGPVCKLYKTKIIKENNLYFDLNVKLGEDTIFVYSYITIINSINTTNEIVYYYNRFNENSATRKCYLELSNWMCLILDKYMQLIETKIKNTDIINKIIAKIAFDKFMYVVHIFYANLTKADALLQFKKTKEILGKYFSQDTAFYESSNIKVQCLKEDNFLELYNILDAANKQSLFKKCIKKILRPILAVLKERIRDNL